MRRLLRVLACTIIISATLFALAVYWPAPQAPLPDPSDSRLIVNARVVDVHTGTASAPTTVAIISGVIARIGDEHENARDLPVLDAGGRYLIPGFWDMHTHAFKLSPQLHFPLAIANGITGTRDMMDCPRQTDPLIACVEDKRRWTAMAASGHLTAPRFVQVASFYFDDPDMTPARAAEHAERHHARGLDVLKVYNRIQPDTYRRLATEGHRLRMPLAGHLPKAINLDEALRLGQRAFEHGHLFTRHCFDGAAAWRAGALDDQDPVDVLERMVSGYDAAACNRTFAAMRDSGAAWIPTQVTREEDAHAHDADFLNDPRLEFLDPLSRWAYADDLSATAARHPGTRGTVALMNYFEHGLALTAAAQRAGVPILVGTDTAIGGFRFHDEMGLLVRAGIPAPDVLRAATIDAARHVGMAQRHGSVEAGKHADLVLLDANPLHDIANTRNVHAVMLGGRLYDRERLDELLRHARQQARTPANMAKLLWGFATSPTSAEL